MAAKLDFEGDKKRTVCGTPNYIAPETLDTKQGHSYEADVWAVGVILYTMLVGRPPFEMADVKQTYQRIKNNDYSFPQSACLSAKAQSLIKSILVTNPADRPTLDQILDHEFFHQGYPIPLLMNAATVSCPPTPAFLQQYMPKGTMDQGVKILAKSAAPAKGWVEANENEQVIVVEFIDYTQKYGLAYLLSNNFVGVYFNDSSKIAIDLKGDRFHYMERKSVEKQETLSIHTLSDFPKEINKKVTILKSFKNHFEEKSQGERAKVGT